MEKRPAVSGTAGAPGTGGAVDGGAALTGWVLSWSDDFNGPDNATVDSTKWVYDTSGSGWSNNELEYGRFERALFSMMSKLGDGFHTYLNVAVGGNFPGAPSSGTTFPQTMKVD